MKASIPEVDKRLFLVKNKINRIKNKNKTKQNTAAASRSLKIGKIFSSLEVLNSSVGNSRVKIVP